VQASVPHLIRKSLESVPSSDRKAVRAALRSIYRADSAEVARNALDEFAAGVWGAKFPGVVLLWRHAWDGLIPFFALPLRVRHAIYSTNAIESLHAQLRKLLKPYIGNSQATAPLLWLAVRGGDHELRALTFR
jgi:transposase-like protein